MANCELSQDLSGSSKRETRHFFYRHCHQNLSKTTFYQHRRLFYEPQTKKWCASRVFPSQTSNEPMFTASDDESRHCSEDELELHVCISDEECGTDSEPHNQSDGEFDFCTS